MKRDEIQGAFDRRLSGMTVRTEHINRVLCKAEGEEPMKKKLTAGVVLAFALALMTLAALAAELSGSYISNVFKRNHGIELTEEAQALFRREKPLAVVELQDAVVTIREGAADGRVVYLYVETQKKENANVIIAPEAAAMEDRIEWMKENLTYGEYVGRTGAKTLQASLAFKVDGAKHGDGWGSEIFDENGTMMMETGFVCPTDSKALHITGTVYAGEIESPASETKEFSFDLPVAELEERTFAVGQKVPGSKVVLDELKLIKSPITMYYEAAYHYEDEKGNLIPPKDEFGDTAQLYFFDWNFEYRILHGTQGGGQIDRTDKGFVEKASMDLKDFPRFGLLLYVGGEDPDTLNGSLEIDMQQNQ